MGLDSYLFKRGKSPRGKIIAALEMKPNHSAIQLGYWRKNGTIHELFCAYSKTGEINCVDVILTKENLIEVLKLLKKEEDEEYSIKVITQAIEETDFEHEEVFYYAWY